MVKPTRSHICPHLGLKSDPSTALHFASMGNYCHHVNPPDVVRDSHQNEFCLTAEHVNCPVYKTAEVGRLPRKYRAGRSGAAKKKVRIGTVPIVIGLVLLVLAAFLVPELTGTGRSFSWVFGGTSGDDFTPTPEPTKAAFPTIAATSGGLGGMRPFCQPPPTWNPYVVTRVDTFEKLSITYARPVEELLKANCRTDVNDLQMGETIYLPELPTATPTNTATITSTPTRRIYTYGPPLPTWTGTYKIIRYPTNTPTPTPPPPTEVPATQAPPPTQAPTVPPP